MEVQVVVQDKEEQQESLVHQLEHCTLVVAVVEPKITQGRKQCSWWFWAGGGAGHIAGAANTGGGGGGGSAGGSGIVIIRNHASS